METGECPCAVTLPATEMPIDAVQSGWAEQDPHLWWRYVGEGIRRLVSQVGAESIRAIGITYQMHGLVCLDRAGKPLRKSIIWCDSRAVEIGRKAFDALGPELCLEHLLNSPGNFTASKLAWVKEHEPELFAQIDRFMLPGDYILYRLTGDLSTTRSGLSEQILWDFKVIIGPILSLRTMESIRIQSPLKSPRSVCRLMCMRPQRRSWVSQKGLR